MKLSYRTLAWFSIASLVAAGAFVIRDGMVRLETGRILLRVESLSIQAASAGRISPSLLAENLRLLREAEQLDPREVGVLIARGSQYLLMGRTEKAIAAYEEALEMELRPEIYLNLGRAHLTAGDRTAAIAAFERAVALFPQLDSQIPESVREDLEAG